VGWPQLRWVTTVWNISTAVGSSQIKTPSPAQRPLVFPDELMTLRGGCQLLLIVNGNPVTADRTPWFQDEEWKELR
jgi:type IV secretory pathway TraG/TraD family ATPase VirD4